MMHHMIKHVLAVTTALIALCVPLTASAQATQPTSPYITTSTHPALTIGVSPAKPSAITLTTTCKTQPTVIFTNTDHQLTRQGSQDSALTISSPAVRTTNHILPFFSKDSAPMVAFTVLVVMVAWTSIGGNEVVGALFKKWHRRS